MPRSVFGREWLAAGAQAPVKLLAQRSLKLILWLALIVLVSSRKRGPPPGAPVSICCCTKLKPSRESWVSR